MSDIQLFEKLKGNGHQALALALESLLADYPVAEHAEIAARLAVDYQVMDTLLELATYRLLHRAGHKVKTIHPDISAKCLKNNPDFLVELSSGDEAIVEATCGSPSSQKIKDQEDQVRRMLDGLRPHLKDGEWHFQMWFKTNKGVAIPYKKLAAEIKRQVAAKSSAECELGFQFVWQQLTIQLKESRRPVAGGNGEVNVFACGWLKDEIEALPSVDRIRRVLDQKAKHYGPVAQPCSVHESLSCLT